MSSRYVPVHMGSPRFSIVDIGPFRVTEVWFPPGLVLPPHVHERAIFAVMLRGSFEDVFDSRTHDCPPSTVFTEPAGERHANRMERAGAHVLVVQPDPGQDDLLRPCREVLEGIHNFRHGRIAERAWRVSREIRAPDTVSPIAIEGLVLEMLSVAARLDEEQRAGGHPPEWLDRAQDVIHSRFQDRLRVADVAEEVEVHPVHLARTFREHFHMPIGSYIRRLRLEWASKQLEESEESLSAIAFRAGFADQSHFTRAFKRYSGLPPGRYRERRWP